MPILPSQEFSSPSVHSPSGKRDSSPYSSTASTPSRSPSPSSTPPPLDMDTKEHMLARDEHKAIERHSAAAAPAVPATAPLPSQPQTRLSSSSFSSPSAAAAQSPALGVALSAPRASAPSSVPMSPVLSSYPAYPPPLHPSMVNVTVLSPSLQPQPMEQQALSSSQPAMLQQQQGVSSAYPTAAPPSVARSSYGPPHTLTAPTPPSSTTSSSSFAPSSFAATAQELTSSLSSAATQSASPSSTAASSPSSSSAASTANTPSPHGHHFSPHFSMFTCILNPALSVTCFRRGGPDGARLGPLFVVREFDAKVIRSSPKLARPHSTTASGEPSATSEQAFRASIRQAMLNMNLRPENASKSEIRVLKAQGILGKRAPSASLLTAEDCCRLLIAFHKEECAKELRDATLNWKEVEAQWLENQQRSAEAGAGVDGLSDFTSSTIPIGKAFTHIPLKDDALSSEAHSKHGDAGRAVVVPHIIKVGEGIDEESMQADKGPTRTKAELKEVREREKRERKEEKEQVREQKRVEREAKKAEKEQEKEKRKRKRKADASPMMSAAPGAGLEALLSAVEDASGGVTVRAPSSLPNIIRALSTPPSLDGRSSMVAAGQSFRLPSAAVHSMHSAMSSKSSPLYAPIPHRPQTPIGLTSTLTSTSPGPTSISPTSHTPLAPSAFSSPSPTTANPRALAQPQPPPPHASILDRQHSGSTSPTGSDAAGYADERLVMVRVLSTESERAERMERTRMKLDGFGLTGMEEGKAEGAGVGMVDGGEGEDKGESGAGREDVDKEMATIV